MRDTWGAPRSGWPSFGPDGRKLREDAAVGEKVPDVADDEDLDEDLADQEIAAAWASGVPVELVVVTQESPGTGIGPSRPSCAELGPGC